MNEWLGFRIPPSKGTAQTLQLCHHRQGLHIPRRQGEEDHCHFWIGRFLEEFKSNSRAMEPEIFLKTLVHL